jgi:WD40 repeat protein
MVLRFTLLLLACPPADALAFPLRPPRFDAAGDPLPDRAVARLGTTRFRHPSPLEAEAYSPDGRLVAAASSAPSVIRVWERRTGLLRDEWRFDDPAVPAQLVFGPDGTRLYAGRSPCRAVPWAMRDLARRTTADVGPTGEQSFAFQTLAPDGRHGVLVGGDRVTVWDLAANREIASFERPERLVADVAAVPDLGWVAVCHTGTKYTVTRLSTGKELWAVEGDWDGILPNQPVAFAPDGRRVAIRTEAGRIGVYDVVTGKAEVTIRGSDLAGAVSAMRFSPDGRTLVVSWKWRWVRLYELPTGKERARLPVACGSPTDIAIAPDSRTMSAADPQSGQAVRFYDMSRGTPVDADGGPVTPIAALAVSPDGSAVACVSDPGGETALTVWDADAGKPRWSVATGRFADVAFSPDGVLVAAPCTEADNPIRLWDARSGKGLGDLAPNGNAARSVAFFPDGRLVAAVGASLAVWDTKTKRRLPEAADVPRGIDRVAVASDGRQAVVTTPEVFVRRLPADDRRPLPSIPFQKTPTGFALSPDGRLLATADGTDSARLWELLSGLEVRTIECAVPVVGVAFAPGGHILALATGGGTVLHDVPRNAARLALPMATTADTLVAFSADGRRLVTAGNRDSTATAWDVADVVRRPVAVAAKPIDLDGCWAALADSDPKVGYAAVWKLAADPDQAVQLLAAELGGPLPSAARIARLIADLDHPRYPARERATRELEAVGEQAVEALREARGGKMSAEQAERIDGLLGKLAGQRPSPDRLRTARAVAALELIGNPQARAVIEEVTKGPSGAPRTQEAKAALGRWR